MTSLNRASNSLRAVAGLAIMLTGCESTTWTSVGKGDTVVYALGPRADVRSPLAEALKPACPALEFDGTGFVLSAGHAKPLQEVASKIASQQSRLVVAAYTRPGLPPEYARVLTERRAHAVRQRLIELGIEPARIQTAGFGNDFPLSGPTSDVVVVFEAN